jgi:hypothetical protein
MKKIGFMFLTLILFVSSIATAQNANKSVDDLNKQMEDLKKEIVQKQYTDSVAKAKAREAIVKDSLENVKKTFPKPAEIKSNDIQQPVKNNAQPVKTETPTQNNEASKSLSSKSAAGTQLLEIIGTWNCTGSYKETPKFVPEADKEKYLTITATGGVGGHKFCNGEVGAPSNDFVTNNVPNGKVAFIDPNSSCRKPNEETINELFVTVESKDTDKTKNKLLTNDVCPIQSVLNPAKGITKDNLLPTQKWLINNVTVKTPNGTKVNGYRTCKYTCDLDTFDTLDGGIPTQTK